MSWPKMVHAVQLENRLGDEIEAELEEYPHGKDGVVLKVVVKRKGDPVGIIKP
jgi:hypothetical protein